MLGTNLPLCAKKNIDKEWVKTHLATNLRFNRDYLYGLYYLECYFCKKFYTPIEFDMELHIFQLHRKELFNVVPLRGRGTNLDGRVRFVLSVMRKRAKVHRQFLTEEHF
jgi:hypothetical protein